jgi:hypothetical protein
VGSDGRLAETVGWIGDADGAALTVDAVATCPSTADILAAVGKK